MKKSLIASLLLSLVAVSAHASGVQGAGEIGGKLTVFGGTVTGNAGSSASSSAQAATTVFGNGSSIQKQANVTSSGASVGGTINAGGVTVATNSFGNTTSTGSGKTFGDAPALSSDGTQSILNGGATVGDGEAVSGVTSSFSKAALGGSVKLSGFGEFGSF